MIVFGTYVSIWDGGTVIQTACKFNTETKDAFDIETSDVDGLEICEDEHVEHVAAQKSRHGEIERADAQGGDGDGKLG